MNKYHNRNRIFSPIMTIHDILTLHILSSFLPLFLSFLSFSLFFFPFSPSLFYPLFLLFLSLSLSSLFLSSLSLSLFSSLLSSLLSLPIFFPPFLSLSVFSVFYREGRTLSHHPDVERYCARLSE